jgi:hypothetical protein
VTTAGEICRHLKRIHMACKLTSLMQKLNSEINQAALLSICSSCETYRSMKNVSLQEGGASAALSSHS